MKKTTLFFLIMCGISFMTACNNGTTSSEEEFPEVGKDFKILLEEDHNISKTFHLQILVDTIYKEDYLLYFSNKFRSEYTPNENTTVFIYDTTFSVDFLKKSLSNIYGLSDEEYLALANHELFITDDTTYGMYYLLKDDDRYKKLAKHNK